MKETEEEVIAWRDYLDFHNLKFRTYNIIKNCCTNPDCGQCPHKPEDLKGRITMITQKVDNRTFKAQVAYCGPKDLKNYTRAKGQDIALYRFKSGKHLLEFTLGEDETVGEVAKIHILRDAKRKNVFWMEDVKPEHMR